MIPKYTDAESFFEAVRDACIESSRVRRALSRMRDTEGIRAASCDGDRVTGGSRGDGMGRVARRIDFESMNEGRLSENDSLIGLAVDLIYGPDCRGGVCAILGSATADALWWRFCKAASWDECADMVGMSRSWCQSAVYTAFDTIDSLGGLKTALGEGMAE